MTPSDTLDRTGAAIPASPAAHIAGLAGILAACAGVVAWLMSRFPYDGLYGQDAYAYYDQAVALWQELTGHPPAPGTQAFRWPIGYHLHIIAGFLLGGPGTGGGRAITLLMTITAPLLLYMIVGKLWPVPRSNIAAGLVAGGTLLLTGTYMRMGLSLMADVPSLFWTLLSVYSALRAWPPDHEPDEGRSTNDEVQRKTASSVLHPPHSTFRVPHPQFLWSALAGASLGVAVLVRFGAVLLLPPLLLYLLLRRPALRLMSTKYEVPDTSPSLRPSSFVLRPQRDGRTEHISSFLCAALGFAVALLPEGIYLATHPGAFGYSAFLSDWHVTNIISTTLTSVDGTLTVERPNLWFYLFSPLANGSDFVSFWCLPAFLLGAVTLVWERRWPIIAFLGSWWLLPALFFSGTPYQAHRFALFYLPALLTVVGIGAATAITWAIATLRGRQTTHAPASLAAGLVLLTMGICLWQDQNGMRNWVATHASWKTEERQVIGAAQQALGTAQAAVPRVISLGATAAMSYYTNWTVIDIYNNDEASIARFFAAPGPRLLVLPESSLATQWANTPVGTRWSWLRAHYTLTRTGKAGIYTVYSVADHS